MAMGTGSAIAHRAVGAVMGPTHSYGTSARENSSEAAAPASASSEPQGPCMNQRKAFNECINKNVGDIEKCQVYVDMLQACKRGELA